MRINLTLFHFYLLSFFGLANLHAQSDTITTDQSQEDLIESYLQGQDEEAEFDYNDLFDQLDYLRRRPLNLNKVAEADLDVFPFLTDLQKISLLNYQKEHGELLSIYELQAVPNFDVATIKQLLPFVKINASTAPTLPGNWKTDGQHQVIMRWAREVEEKAGYAIEDTSRSRYLGDRNALYLRYRFSFSNRLSFGFTAEKDAGEEFFKGSNKQGFDFYSAHFFYHNPKGRLRTLALGDFNVSMGQGLILFNGFAPRKSPLTTSIKRSSRPLRKYSSVNEVDFFRGAAATFGFGKKWDLTAFASSKLTDGNIGEPELDPDTAEPLLNFVSSLQTSGKHRTPSEIADENALRRTSAGAILRYRERRFRASFNALYNHLDQPLLRDDRLYNQYFPSGSQLLNFSADYSYTYRNYHLFGETAMSDNGAVATSNGLLVGLDQKLDVALLYRHFPRDYQALNAQPFAETSGARNESGAYIGMALRPANGWQLNAYFDIWQHPWLRFRTDSPSGGNEWLVRLNYSIRRKIDAHVQIRNEIKLENQDSPDGHFDQSVERHNFQGRIHFAYKLNKTWEWRTRFYAGFVELGDDRYEGTAIYQDLIFKSRKWPVAFSTRYVLFGSDDSRVRFYAYENDVLNAFSVPSYSGRGTRFYLNARWKVHRGLSIEARYARTDFTDREVIGSGLDEIPGSTRSDYKLQVRMTW